MVTHRGGRGGGRLVVWLQGFTLTFPQFKGDAAGNVFMKTVKTGRQAVVLGDLGPGRFFSKPKAWAEAASQSVTPLHSVEPVGTSRRRGSSPDRGSWLSQGPAPLPPWGLHLPPTPVRPHSGEVPSNQFSSPGCLQERREAGAPAGLCPRLPGPALSTASPSHSFLKEAARNLLRWQFSLPRGPGVDHGWMDRSQAQEEKKADKRVWLAGSDHD